MAVELGPGGQFIIGLSKEGIRFAVPDPSTGQGYLTPEGLEVGRSIIRKQGGTIFENGGSGVVGQQEAIDWIHSKIEVASN